MYTFRHFLLSLFVFTATINSVHSQEYDYQETDITGEAYAQSSFNTHWSAYVPVALIVGAAIWFGVADGTSSNSNSNSKNGLGSLNGRNRSRSYQSGSYSKHFSSQNSYNSH